MERGKVSAILAIFVVMGLFSPPGLYGANLDVCPSGCTYSSIGDAVNAASSGDVVRVAQGRYFEDDYIYIGDSITLTIQGGWDAGFSSRSSDPSLTVIDRLGKDYVFYIYPYDGEAIELTIEGFTITGAMGIGIYATAYTSSSSTSDTSLGLTLRGNLIKGNGMVAYNNGGGVNVYSSTYSDTHRSFVNLTMEGNRIIQNKGYSGGGIYIGGYSSSSYSGRSVLKFRIEGNEINGNSAINAGGAYLEFSRALYENGGAGSVIKGNVISGNSANYYPGLYFYVSNSNPSAALSIVNNIISGNQEFSDYGAVYLYSSLSSPTVDLINNTITANNGYGLGAVSRGSGGTLDNFTLNLKSNIIIVNHPWYGNYDVNLDNYSDGNLVVNGLNNLLGNIDVNDAIYNNLGGNLSGDPKIGDDFYPVAGSPCINTADAASAAATDIYGNARVGAPDIGAVEYQGSDHYAVMSSPFQTIENGYFQTKTPIVSSDPLVARPFAVGNVEGGTLSLKIALPAFSSPVDVYAGIYAPHIDPVNIYQIASDLSIPTLASAGPVKWRSGITAAVNESLYGGIDLTWFPKGKYYLYLMVTPQNTLGIAYYYYKTYFIVD